MQKIVKVDDLAKKMKKVKQRKSKKIKNSSIESLKLSSVNLKDKLMDKLRKSNYSINPKTGDKLDCSMFANGIFMTNASSRNVNTERKRFNKTRSGVSNGYRYGKF